MKIYFYSILAAALVLGLSTPAAAATPVNPTEELETTDTGIYSWDAQSADEAIEYSRSLASQDVQVKYLKHQAREFLDAGEYNDAERVAEYLQDDLQAASSEVQDILQEARSPEYEATGAEPDIDGMEDRGDVTTEEPMQY